MTRLLAALMLCSCAMDVAPRHVPMTLDGGLRGDCTPDVQAVQWCIDNAGDTACRFDLARSLWACDGGIEVSVWHMSLDITRARRYGADREITHELQCGCFSCLDILPMLLGGRE